MCTYVYMCAFVNVIVIWTKHWIQTRSCRTLPQSALTAPIISANAVALWSIVTCKKTRTSMKLLLVPVFLSPLVNNLVCRPMEAELILGLTVCNKNQLPDQAKTAYFFLYVFLTYLEFMIIAAVSVFR